MQIAITSCAKYKQFSIQPVWQEIQTSQPDVLLLLGDNVYIENNDPDSSADLAADLRVRYAEQLSEPNFRRLLGDMKNRNKDVMAIWDDHDSFGNDRGGNEFPPDYRDTARAEFHRAFPYSTNLPEVYYRRDIGDVTFLLLDVRSYRDDRRTNTKSRDAMLGAAQWLWLEAELANTNRFTIVASGTTIYPYKRECWDDFPKARDRMIALLKNRSGVLFVSGDIHENQISGKDGVIEVVSSGCARRTLISGAELRNYGLLDFSNTGVSISLKSLNPKNRHSATIALNHWQYP